MLGAATPYFVAISAILFCALSAGILIYSVNHFDPPETRSSPEQVPVDEKLIA